MGIIDYSVSDKQLELLARILLPEIKKFFSDETVKEEFEVWRAERINDIAED